MQNTEDLDINQDGDLFYLTQMNKIDRISKLLASNPNFDILNLRDNKDFSLLHFCAVNSQTQLCLKYINHALDQKIGRDKIKNWINSENNEGFTCIHYSSFKGNLDLIYKLEEYGADIYKRNHLGLNVLHIAAQSDQPHVLAYFISVKGMSIFETDDKGNTPLHWAAFLGVENSLNFLISWGSPLNLKENENGYTPLHLAVISGNAKTVRKLVLRGANIDAKNNNGELPIDIAKKNDFSSITSMLTKRTFLKEFFSIRQPVTAKRNRKSMRLFLFLSITLICFNILFVFPYLKSNLWIIGFILMTSINVGLYIVSLRSDPGYLKGKKKEDLFHFLLKVDPQDICPDCAIIKPKRSKHCELCNCCVAVFDHHCPWIDNCVGAYNHGFFLGFILSTLASLLFILLMAISHLNSDEVPIISHEIIAPDENSKEFICIIDIMISSAFLLPIMVLNYVQLVNFLKGETTNERYGSKKNKSFLKESAMEDGNSLKDLDLNETLLGQDNQKSSGIKNCLNMCFKNSKKKMEQDIDKKFLINHTPEALKISEMQAKFTKGLPVILKSLNRKYNEVFSDGVTTDILFLYFGKGSPKDAENLNPFFKLFDIVPTLILNEPYGIIKFKDEKDSYSFFQNLSDIGVKNTRMISIEIDNKPRFIYFLFCKTNISDLISSKMVRKNKFIEDFDESVGLNSEERFLSVEMQEKIIKLSEENKWKKDKSNNVSFQEYDIKSNEDQSAGRDLLKIINSFNISDKFENKSIDYIKIYKFFPGQGLDLKIPSHKSYTSNYFELIVGNQYVSELHKDDLQIKFVCAAGSLIEYKDEIRYSWEKKISPVKIDTYKENIFERKKWYSIFIFSHNKSRICNCKWTLFCDSQSKSYSSFDINPYQTKDTSTNNEIKLTEIEKKYVYETYDKIAPHFSNTRYLPWPGVEKFLNGLEEGTLVADIGCGNGRYMNVNKKINMIGFDRSFNLLSCGKSKFQENQFISADNLKIPLRSNVFDVTISIAVIHHFSNIELRLFAIKEIVRITRPGGIILIYVWAKEQEKMENFNPDVLVPWNLQDKYDLIDGKEKELGLAIPSKIHQRYYHMFEKSELMDLLSSLSDIKINEIYFDHDNWCAIVSKVI